MRFTFTEARPPTFRKFIQPTEHGFRANVDPEVPHPRRARRASGLGAGDRVPTQLFNSDSALAAHLYRDLADERRYA